MKKFVWSGLLVAVVSFLVWSKDPLNDIVNFIFAGTVPGTTISIGFWSTMTIALALFLLIRAAAKNTRHKMIMLEVEKNNSKKTKTALEATATHEFDRSQRSVIAARKSEPAL